MQIDLPMGNITATSYSVIQAAESAQQHLGLQQTTTEDSVHIMLYLETQPNNTRIAPRLIAQRCDDSAHHTGQITSIEIEAGAKLGDKIIKTVRLGDEAEDVH